MAGEGGARSPKNSETRESEDNAALFARVRSALFAHSAKGKTKPHASPALDALSEIERTVRPDSWVLVERYVARYPHDWRLVFKRDDVLLEVAVSEEAWRAFHA